MDAVLLDEQSQEQQLEEIIFEGTFLSCYHQFLYNRGVNYFQNIFKLLK